MRNQGSNENQNSNAKEEDKESDDSFGADSGESDDSEANDGKPIKIDKNTQKYVQKMLKTTPNDIQEI